MAGEAGLTGALAEHVAGADLPDAGGEQLELNEIAQQPLFKPMVVEGRRLTGGRPAGALNKRTQKLADHILSRHRHPLLAAAEVCDLPLAELAKQLACSLLDAAKYQQQVREFLARYVLQQMPQAVQIDSSTVGTLMIVRLDGPNGAGNGGPQGGGLGMRVIEHNQGVSGGDLGSSHGSPSHGDGKAFDNKGLGDGDG